MVRYRIEPREDSYASVLEVFHVKHITDLTPLFESLGFTDPPWTQLASYASWLVSEALPAGGIGPQEAERVVSRHIGDACAYAYAFPSAPPSLTDYGSGVGLPGIPLALCWPATQVRLVDRSGRRVELMRRVVRVLGLDNVTVHQEDVDHDRGMHSAIVTRALFPVDVWMRKVAKRLTDDGVAVTSLGDVPVPTEVPDGLQIESLVVPDGVLDHAVTLLIMGRTTI